jgi:hypothetical protein
MTPSAGERSAFSRHRAQLAALAVFGALLGVVAGCGDDSEETHTPATTSSRALSAGATTDGGEETFTPGSSPKPLPPPPDDAYQPDVSGGGYEIRPPLPEKPLRPLRTCEKIRVQQENGEHATELGPPIPEIRAERDGDQVLVSYRFLAFPDGCRPKLIEASLTPPDPRDSPSYRRVPVRTMEGVVRVRTPHGRGPYTASLVAYSRQGAGSVTHVRVP